MSDEQVRETLASLSGVPVERIAEWQLVNDDGVARLMVRLTPEVQMIGVEVRAEPTPEPETCGAEHPSGNYWCTLAVHGDDEPHRCVYQGRELARWHEPTPEPPKWRQLVNDYLDDDPGEKRVALSYVLSSLSGIAAGESWREPHSELASIIAVCEQQVGDGWQADPGRVKCDSENDICNIDCLLDCFKAFNDHYYRYVSLGNRAASWLAHLTGEVS